MEPGCYTALVTPFAGDVVHEEGLEKLVDFQIKNGITGILAVGTTGESPVLTWNEHLQVIGRVARQTRGKCLSIAGTGSNNTAEAIEGSRKAAEGGVDAVLLVDPYYNGPSSLEIRREYVAPIARAVPDTQIICYIIPGRTGAQLLPEDLALLYRDQANVATVKEATGNLDNMRRTRACCGPDYTILSGDDGMTLPMLSDTEIQAQGVISVISNLVPGPMARLIRLQRDGKSQEAAALNQALSPLFGLVTVTTQEETPWGAVGCRARNPLAIKTLMALLGLPAGPCRRPLGKMTAKGLDKVIDITRTVQRQNPELLVPLADYFQIDIDARLENPEYRKELCYPAY
jgi:4-hydroxy-tetrahydrodipicolinate synthase